MNIDRCPKCDRPTHASESNDEGVCRACLGVLTADTITDEQIRELKVEAREWIRAHGPTMASWNRAEYFKRTALIYSARVSLAELRAKRGDSRAKARARCAEILNARAVQP